MLHNSIKVSGQPRVERHLCFTESPRNAARAWPFNSQHVASISKSEADTLPVVIAQPASRVQDSNFSVRTWAELRHRATPKRLKCLLLDGIMSSEISGCSIPKMKKSENGFGDHYHSAAQSKLPELSAPTVPTTLPQSTLLLEENKTVLKHKYQEVYRTCIYSLTNKYKSDIPVTTTRSRNRTLFPQKP